MKIDLNVILREQSWILRCKNVFLFIQKHIYNGHINEMQKNKTKIHITVIRRKATITSEMKLKKEQLQN